MPLKKNKWLTNQHPIYKANIARWELNEARFGGIDETRDELIPFDWESDTGDHYRMRQDNATYLNFPERFADILVGHMMRQAPDAGLTLNFGTLGQVRRVKDIDLPTPAELLYYNTDGVGADGQQWNAFWKGVIKSAFPCGFAWVLCEAPEEAPTNYQEVIDGKRPFGSYYSPVSVTNWDFTQGQLGFAVIVRNKREIEIEERPGSDGRMKGNDGVTEYLVLVRRGYKKLGNDFINGGWFIFDADGELKDFGDYAKTRGEVPMSPLFYERIRPTKKKPKMARTPVDELGNAAVSYMNVASAADYDAWDGAATVRAIMGADKEGFNLFVTKVKEGSKYAPVPNNSETGKTPGMVDASSGSIAGNVFDQRLQSKRKEARELMLNEIQTAPYASGESKKVSFTDARAPRLSSLASEVETTQNAFIRWMEMFYAVGVNPEGFNPEGAVEWPKDFDLLDPAAAALEFFTIEQVSGYRSPTAGSMVMGLAVKSLGIAGDDATRTLIEEEYKTSALEFAKEHKLAIQKMIEERAVRVNPTAAGGTPPKVQ